jgi:hypothetical protein
MVGDTVSEDALSRDDLFCSTKQCTGDSLPMGGIPNKENLRVGLMHRSPFERCTADRPPVSSIKKDRCSVPKSRAAAPEAQLRWEIAD